MIDDREYIISIPRISKIELDNITGNWCLEINFDSSAIEPLRFWRREENYDDLVSKKKSIYQAITSYYLLEKPIHVVGSYKEVIIPKIVYLMPVEEEGGKNVYLGGPVYYVLPICLEGGHNQYMYFECQNDALLTKEHILLHMKGSVIVVSS